MITLFTIPKPFGEHSAVLQRNAIRSWVSALPQTVEIILVGDDRGVKETASEFGLIHIPRVEKSPLGTPLISSAFSEVQKTARHKTLMYINADIILPDNGICEAVNSINMKENHYIMVGRRIDINIIETEIDFNADWKTRISLLAKTTGKLHGYSGIDYIIFPKNIPFEMPPFIVGRPGWDNWFLWKARASSIPIIDATNVITALHQNHDYSHSVYGTKNKVTGPETETNIRLAGGRRNLLTIREADFLMTKDKKLIKPPLTRRILSTLAGNKLWMLLLSLKRNAQEFLYMKKYSLSRERQATFNNK